MAIQNKRSAWVCAWLAASSALVAAVTQAQDVSFITYRDFDVGPNPSSVAVGDFNGDGVQDLAVAHSGSTNVSVLLGNGDGTFQGQQNFAVGNRPQSVAVGDFNGDGLQDLAVAYMGTPPSYTDGGVAVLLGNGDGTFQATRSFGAGNAPVSVAVGDFNGDGVLDLAVANAGYDECVEYDPETGYCIRYEHRGGSTSVLLGQSDGTFGSAVTVNGGISPAFIVTADFNGDGVLDLAVADDTLNSVSVLLGNGNGSFQVARNFGAGYRPRSIAVGDFNGDGWLDLATNFSVLLGNGDGSFGAARNLAVGGSFVAVGDFNGDGAQDLAVAQGPGNHMVSVLLGSGDGSFQGPPPSFRAGDYLESIAVGDFNGDGFQDLAVANATSSGTVSVLLGNGDGSFQEARTFGAGSRPWSVAVGDFNGDGFQDLAVTDDNSRGTVLVLLGNGDGSFQAPLTFGTGDNPVSVAVGDFNGDGVQDLAVANLGFANQGTVSVLLGNGDGTFQVAQDFPSGRVCWSVAVGDFNGDGFQDLAVASHRESQPFDGSVSVLLSNGDGTFQAARSYATGGASRSVAVGDFNDDGRLDLAVGNAFGSISVLLGNGDGSFQAAQNFAASGPVSVVVGDFNGDGVQDLAGDGVSVLLGNGDGSFQAARNFGGAGAFLVVGDFNGDGLQDLVGFGGLGVAVLINNTPH